MMKKYILLLFLSVFSNFSFSSELKLNPDKKIIVAQDGTGNFKTIQEAVDAANTDNGAVLIFLSY